MPEDVEGDGVVLTEEAFDRVAKSTRWVERYTAGHGYESGFTPVYPTGVTPVKVTAAGAVTLPDGKKIFPAFFLTRDPAATDPNNRWVNEEGCWAEAPDGSDLTDGTYLGFISAEHTDGQCLVTTTTGLNVPNSCLSIEQILACDSTTGNLLYRQGCICLKDRVLKLLDASGNVVAGAAGSCPTT